MSRLEEIKTLHERIIETHEQGDFRMELDDLLRKLFTDEHTDYLIQQAERVENLEKLNMNTDWKLEQQVNITRQKIKEIKRYKQALEEIKVEAEWMIKLSDCGEKFESIKNRCDEVLEEESK